MAGLLDLFSGRSSDIYGEGLLTPEQRGGLGNIGLLALAGKLGQLAGPSFSPVPDFGAALGQAAGAYGASQEGAGTAALNAILTGQKGRKLQQELEFGKQIPGTLAEIMRIMGGLGSGGGEGSGSTGGGAGGGAALTPGGALTGNPGSLAMAETPEVQEAVAHKLATTSGIQHWASFNPKLYSALQAAGLPTSGPLTEAQWQQANPLIKRYESGGGQNIPNYRFDAGHTAGGTHQITNSTWNSIGGPAIAASMRGNAAPAAAAPAPAAGGGLLAPTAPNPLSDAEPMLPIVRPGPQAAGGPFAVPAAPGDDARLRNLYDAAVGRVGRESFEQYKARVGPSFGAGSGSSAAAAPEEQPGFAGRQLVAQLLSRPPLDDVSQYRQVAGPGAADVAAAPRAPLPVMGPTGVELPPMQGPLAAPAPAAAAPAAAGPGLLAPPGAPAAALPRGANPAYGNVSNLLGILGVQAEAAGLKNVFAPLADAFRQSPAFQAQLEREKARVGVEFAGPKAEAEKAVELRYSEALAAASARGNLPSQIILKNIEAQNDLRNRLAVQGQGITFDKDGNGTLTDLPGAKPDTPDLKEYQAYVKDQQMRNLPVESLVEWSRTNKRAGAATTEVKIGEHAGEKMIDLGIKSMEAAEEGAKAARSRTQQYGQIALAAQNFVTGPTAEGWLTVKSYLKDAGIIKGTDVPDGEVLRLAARRLEIAAAPKGQGSITDFERGMLREAIAGMATSPEGLARAIVIGKRLDDYDIQVAQIHRDVARANKNTPDYLEVQDRIAKLGPPLSPQERSALEALQPERGAAAAGAVPAGLPPGSVPAGSTKDGKPAFRSPDGKIWSE